MDVFRSGGNFHSTIAHKVFRLPCEVEEVAEYILIEDRLQKQLPLVLCMVQAQQRLVNK